MITMGNVINKLKTNINLIQSLQGVHIYNAL